MSLILLFPLLGALLLMTFRHMGHRLATLIGVGSIALSAVTVAWYDMAWLAHADDRPWLSTLWMWMEDDHFIVPFSLRLDGLSLTMMSVVSGVGVLIHIFAAWYMREDRHANPHYLYTRFFACMNLFVFSMLALVLGANLMVLFFGWEGVGVCSYLLIGYYHRDPANGWAAYKAFIMTRLGDLFLAVAMFMLWLDMGTMDLYAILAQAPACFARHPGEANVIGLLLLGGAVGKSAQLPLQTWLADAMAGPTPVSALIHAATMVTAGVYLIARLHGVYDYAPIAMQTTAVIGTLTLLMAGLAALAQRDIKRILAYSTMSQLGYMFVALGIGAWQAAIFHLMVHAFFKALLFLASGSVIIACHHEQDIYRMGGLARALRLPWLGFLIGGAALVALPLVTAGFYSKDQILWLSFATGHAWLWSAGIAGAFLTALYTCRLFFVVFYGPRQGEVHVPRGWMHNLPLVVLMVLSTGIGALIHPPLGKVLPALEPATRVQGLEGFLAIVSSTIVLVGILLAASLFLGRRRLVTAIVASPTGGRLWRCFHAAFGFDALYDRLFVRSFLFLAQAHRIHWFERFTDMLRRGALAWPHRGHQADWIDVFGDLIPAMTRLGSRALAATQNGYLRYYAATFITGAALVIVLLVLG